MVMWNAGKPRLAQPDPHTSVIHATFPPRVATPASSLVDIIAPARQIGDIANEGVQI